MRVGSGEVVCWGGRVGYVRFDVGVRITVLSLKRSLVTVWEGGEEGGSGVLL